MRKYELWLETEYEDGGRFRRKLYFDTMKEVNECLDKYENNEYEYISDYEIQIIDEEED